MGIISEDITRAIDLLTKDHLVAIPTETVYGLAANIYSETAVKKIFITKKRPHFNPLIVHIPNISKLEDIVSHVPEKARQLANAFWPGSLTLILPKNDSIPNIVTGGKDTVGVRIPNHPKTLELLERLEFPLAAPSANPFNRISPTKPSHVAEYFSDSIQMVLDGGVCKKGVESTIVGFEDQEPIIYRLGAIALEDIEAVIGKVRLQTHKEHQPDAPGMLLKHYSPKTKIIVSREVVSEIARHPNEKIGFLGFQKALEDKSIVHQEILSKKGDLEEAAANFYEALHQLDTKKLTLIIAEIFPDHGLGKTINDRLQRASS